MLLLRRTAPPFPQQADRSSFQRPLASLLVVLAWLTVATVAVAEEGTKKKPAGKPGAVAGRPNIVLVMTDDQGYGDLGCHGNKQLKTPAIDALHSRSLRLTNYHVDPTCSPTRAALLTGRYSSRTGVWHTIMGRSLMHADEVTLPELLQQAGYQTGIFGKWHLGDNWPLRPQDRGFDVSVIHGGGGVGQTPDLWGNDYFDDTYLRNGKPEKFTGYCTDIWFREAEKFIRSAGEKPFFVYLPTNAAHGPFNVADEYADPYRKAGVPSPRAEFYGMITNIDENVGRLLATLDELGLRRNTLFVFTTDNGTAAGHRGAGGFNAGMRGAKGSEYDGGHRVPCFVEWPAAGFGGKPGSGRDVPQLTAHIDWLPTLAELCGVPVPESLKIDGTSLVPLLKATAGSKQEPQDIKWPERTLVVHSQRVELPQMWRKCAVMTDRWRLVADGDRRELFDMRADPGQQHNVSAEYPRVLEDLSSRYLDWYRSISDRFTEAVQIPLGHPQGGATQLTAHDWHAPIQQVPWNQPHIRRDLPGNGYWTVEIARAGNYRFTLQSRPGQQAVRMKAVRAGVRAAGVEQFREIAPEATRTELTLNLPAGPTRLQTWLEDGAGGSRGAYYVTVEYLGAGDVR